MKSYEKSSFSKFNLFILKQYTSKIMWILFCSLGMAILLEFTFDSVFYVSLDSGNFFQKYILNMPLKYPVKLDYSFIKRISEFVLVHIEKNYFNIFSISVSMLSVLMATFAIEFGSFKVCGIDANVVLKQIFNEVEGVKRLKFLKPFTVSFGFVGISPVLMLLLIIVDFKISFLITFITFLCSQLYLLDLCVSILVDNGIRYYKIPQYLSNEFKVICQSDKEIPIKESWLYDSFIQNFGINGFYESKIILIYIINNFYKDLREEKRKMYKLFYIILDDVREYMYHNRYSENFIEIYFSICEDALKVVKNDRCCYNCAFIATFRNILNCSKVLDSDKEIYIKELDRFCNKIINQYNINDVDEEYIARIVLMLFEIEIFLNTDTKNNAGNFSVFSDNISKLVDYLNKINSITPDTSDGCEKYIQEYLIYSAERSTVKADTANAQIFMNATRIKAEHYGHPVTSITHCYKYVIDDLQNNECLKKNNDKQEKTYKYNKSTVLRIYKIVKAQGGN